ncbi:MAG: indolepyruvate oxidoreductase subunit beta [Candidatus Aenigmatarchaeota archaeon]|nr:indolepyruvate oxidoreductase subunit beta [Candidatus Aenigmarchaeota archaeon]
MNTFNIVVTGIGGQGVLTAAEVIAQAALAAGHDVRTAELHGLSLRFGPLESHVRFGKKVLSPLVPAGRADLLIGLERLETLRALEFAGKKTNVIFDTRSAVPTLMSIKKQRYPSEDETEKMIRKIAKYMIHVQATKAVKKAGFDPVMANVYILGRAVAERMIPLNKKHMIAGITAVVPPKALELNIKVFEMGMASK